MSLQHLDESLDAYIVADLEYTPDEEPRTLASIDEADRALRRMARLDHDLHRAELLAKARVEQVQEWLHSVSEPILREREFWARRVEMWTRAHVAETGSKTHRLPSGTVSLRAGKARVEALRAPTADDNLTRTKVEWDKRAIADATSPGPVAEDVDAPEGYAAHFAVTADGEVLGDVVLLVPTADTFTVKPGGES